jgi:exo-beta-1,3-glucanase (GH17 family)
MSLVAPYTRWVRTYGCKDGLGDAGRIAHSLGLKAALGASLGPNPQDNQRQISCLISAMQRREVDIAVVGNEVLSHHDLPESDVISTLQQVRQAAPGVPVTEAEPYSTLLKDPALIQAEDVVFANTYPYLHGVPIGEAVSQLAKWYSELVGLAGGKQVWLSETGWPSDGGGRAGAADRGPVPADVATAVASPDNECRYAADVLKWASATKVQYFFFESFDAPNKALKSGADTAFYGVFDHSGSAKPCMALVLNGAVQAQDVADPTRAPLP